MKGGSTTYGPNLYLVSNRNFDVENDTIFFVEVTGDLNDPGTTAEVDYVISNIKYGVPPQARQFATHIFDTNDGRILGGFLEDGQIQFVANCMDPSTGFAGVYHGLLTNLTTTRNLTANIIGDSIMDLGYPNISYSGHFEGDNQSIIAFDHTAPDVNAGFSAIYYNYGVYSDLTTIKEGESHVNVLSGSYERWGDYTGSQRKYNEPGVVWVSGNFGEFDAPFFRNNGTWIGELRSNDEPSIAVPPQPENNQLNTATFPNPTDNLFTLEFVILESKFLDISLFDMTGKMVKVLLQQKVKKGENRFSFSTASLAAGQYLLRISDRNGQVVASEKVVVLK
jgi:hypothetical protein